MGTKACLLVLWAAAGALAQRPAFEVASIKPSSPTENAVWIGMEANASTVRYTNITLLDCIRAAYRKPYFLIQGPDWIKDARYEIIAKVGPEGPEFIPEMLQSLLEERFNLKLRREMKEQPVHALTIAPGGPKLEPADQRAASQAATALGPDGKPRPAMVYRSFERGIELTAPAASLPTATEFLSRWMERPVVDLTGLTAQYKLVIAFMPELAGGRAAATLQREDGTGPQFSEPGPTLAEAFRQYGLKLDPRRAPVEILTVLQADRTPKEN